MCKTKLNCAYCNKEFEKENWQIKQSKDNNYKAFYCDIKCQAKHKSELFVNKFKETGLIKCGCCGEEKHYSNFNKNKNRSIGYGSCCKECSKERSSKYYNDNKEELIKNNIKIHNKYFKDKVKIIKEYLGKRTCCGCGKKNIKTFSLLYITNGEKDVNLHKEFGTNTKPERLKVGLENCKLFCHNCEDKTINYKSFKIGNNNVIRIGKN